MLPRDIPLEPRATIRDVLGGNARLVGSRTKVGRDDLNLVPGVISPYEVREAIGLRYGDPAFEEAKYLQQHSGVRDAGVAARWLVGRIAGRRAPAAQGGRPYIVSSHVDALDTRTAVDEIVRATTLPRATLVFFVHPHALNIAATDAAFSGELGQADLVLPDGIGIQLAGRMLGAPFVANVNGTDLTPELLLELAAERVPVVLVGGAPGVAAAAARAFTLRTGVQILGTWDGFGSASDYAEMRKQVAECGRCVVLVGMGSPVQERFAIQHFSDASNVVTITVGGLFDFFAGGKRRAPQQIRELGLEWAWRLALEPKRLASRYLVGNPLFLARVLRQRLRSDWRRVGKEP
jgi:N-acetylglucosaminyldiphosphoundecaprenol N-acetyl-beta-D-mannosaminyltransferase